MRIKNAVVVYTNPTTNEYKLTLEHVKKTLKANKIDYSLADRDYLKEYQFRRKDIVIAVGGDGTFLRAAQFVTKKIVFGVNADPKNKEGFFMKSSRKDFAEKLQKIISGNFKTKKLSRLEAVIDNKKISSLALNEFFIGPRKGYQASKYIIKFKNRAERQKSSGVLVTTPAGSWAWARACGCRPLNLHSKLFQYVVRDPYELKVFSKYQLKHGIISNKGKIEIDSEMLDGVIVADSVGKEYGFSNGGKVVIRMSKKPLEAVWF
ncbi:MAG: NAD(+)/NADH kinase [Nanoarchaeota archaeon]